MAHILFLGGTKFFGLRTSQQLIAAGHKVTLISRIKELPPVLEGKVEHICEDLEVLDDTCLPRTASIIQKVLEDKDIEIIIDTISWRKTEITAIALGIEQSKKHISQYIFCSSVAVYDNWSTIVAQTQTTSSSSSSDISTNSVWDLSIRVPLFSGPQKELIGEELRFRPLIETDATLDSFGHYPQTYAPSFSDFYSFYANGKRVTEKELVEWANKLHFAFTILRPSVIEGENDLHARTWYWVQRLLDGNPILVPDTTPATLYQHVYVDDVANAFFQAINNPNAFNQTFNISGKEVFTVHDYILKIASILDISFDKVVLVPLNEETKKSLSWTFEFPPFFQGLSITTSIEKAESIIGYTPSQSDVWLRNTITWLIETREKHANSLGYEQRSQEIELAHKLNQSHTSTPTL